jgi:hypothetical protein
MTTLTLNVLTTSAGNNQHNNLRVSCSNYYEHCSNFLDSFSDTLKVGECSLKWIQVSGSCKSADNQFNSAIASIEGIRAVIGFKDIPSTVSSAWESFLVLQRAHDSPVTTQNRLDEARYAALRSTIDFTAMATGYCGCSK